MLNNTIGRRRIDFSKSVQSGAGGLFVQLDMLAQLDAQDAEKLHKDQVEGYSPPWAEPVIRRVYRHRELSDRPLIRLALHALYQAIEDLRSGPLNPEFQGSIDWLNECDCPMPFDRVVSELEISVRASRVAIACMYPGILVTVGPLKIIRPTAAAAAILASATKPPLSARKVITNAQDDRAARTAAQHALDARANAAGLAWPLHNAWASVIRVKFQKARTAAKVEAAEARAEKEGV